MDARRAFLATAVACAAAQRWCDANLFAPPRPAIELPMELAHAGGVATQTVFEVRRGDRIDDASLAFAHAWRLGDAQLERLRKAAHDAVKTGAVVPSAVAVVSDDGRHARAAPAAPSSRSCGAARTRRRPRTAPPPRAPAPRASASSTRTAASEALRRGGRARAGRRAVVVLATAPDPPAPSLQACLAAHARAGYARGDPGGALVLAAPSPNGGGDAALASSGASTAGSPATARRRGAPGANTVWDYSASNVPSLAALGISATHVPLGDAPPWRIRLALAAAVSATAPRRRSPCSSTGRSRGTARRRSRRSGRAPTASPWSTPTRRRTAPSARALDAQIAAGRVVLNLRAFGDRDDEWKMPRLAKLFANRKFVISEGTCDPGAVRGLRGGLVFASAATSRPRSPTTATGRRSARPSPTAARALFATRSMATVLRGPVQALLDGRRGVT
ncbi:hypothetical protein SO694_00004556 [Aureococcus anophagefferens]|uniref:Uncharacterized protein n=1 Tax=Aureococcus anophagefferens TaxID=44056 RepID=A0ABR1G907_AURAN